MAVSLILFLSGAVGLILLFNLTVPTLGPRWLLFFLITFVFSGIALPPAYYLHLRFPGKAPSGSVVLIREALFFGIYVDLLIWLQFGKVLNFALGFFLFAGFALIEFILLWRERARFNSDAEINSNENQ